MWLVVKHDSVCDVIASVPRPPQRLALQLTNCVKLSQKDLYICFIDYSKAFDKVKHEKLFEMLNQLDIDGKDLRVLRNLYWDQTAAVRVGGELNRAFETESNDHQYRGEPSPSPHLQLASKDVVRNSSVPN
ncbi:hypothetical protein RRG08_064033 [Elysia crispata]|uniref:Reverse transcriptase domain-containing protein n=1 Tax=Elysia crispata TaxID=231223 RepID=A0AAE0YEY2_9GAST|nr:hypothetical protein RRG08_064033 [Elysia crispata]